MCASFVNSKKIKRSNSLETNNIDTDDSAISMVIFQDVFKNIIYQQLNETNSTIDTENTKNQTSQTNITNLNISDATLTNTTDRIEKVNDTTKTDTSKYLSLVPKKMVMNGTKWNHKKKYQKLLTQPIKYSFYNMESKGDKSCKGEHGVMGSCYSPVECYKRGGRIGGKCCVKDFVCCIFEYYCGDASSEMVMNFRSPDYPLLSTGGLACDFDVQIQPTVCAVRIDFIKVILSKKLGGVCDIDQLIIMNSVDGPTVAHCGDLSKYSTTTAVVPGQARPLKLALVIQNEEHYYWDIRITQVKCNDLQHFNKPTSCGSLPTQPIPSHQYYDQWKNIENNNLAEGIWWNFPEPIFNTYYYASTKRSLTLPKFHEAQERIIRGADAFLHEFPWQVAVFIKEMFFCGGSVINEEYVLSAAHCYLTRDTPVEELILYLGDHDITNNSETIHTVRLVERIDFHSHFHPFLLSNDVALLKLNQPVTFSPAIRPVCLPTPGDNYIGRKAIVVGWGITSFPMGQPSAMLQRLDVDVISNYKCAKVIEEAVNLGMMCAAPTGLQGTCFGDSGGPLIINEKGKEMLIGIVSFGVTGCAVLPGFPDLYTRVSEYLRWIDVSAIPTK